MPGRPQRADDELVVARARPRSSWLATSLSLEATGATDVVELNVAYARRGALARRPARGTRARLSRRPTPNTASRNDPVWVVSRLIDSRMPTAARLMVSAEPPALMNGSGMPVTGRSAVTTIMLTKAWTTSQVVIPQATRPEKVSGACDRDPVALVRDHDEQRHHRQRADEAPLLADDREDEVGRRGRQVEELLAALAEAEAGEPAQAERQQRLDRVVAAAERVAERIQEGLHPLELVARRSRSSATPLPPPPLPIDRPGRAGWRRT